MCAILLFVAVVLAITEAVGKAVTYISVVLVVNAVVVAAYHHPPDAGNRVAQCDEEIHAPIPVVETGEGGAADTGPPRRPTAPNRHRAPPTRHSRSPISGYSHTLTHARP